jgi:pyruvate dehydrogenase E1 component alpha subunit
MSDPATYRSKDEVEDYRKQDPILVLKATLEEQGHLSEEDYGRMDAEAKVKAEEAVKFAEESPEPALETLAQDVLA